MRPVRSSHRVPYVDTSRIERPASRGGDAGQSQREEYSSFDETRRCCAGPGRVNRGGPQMGKPLRRPPQRVACCLDTGMVVRAAGSWPWGKMQRSILWLLIATCLTGHAAFAGDLPDPNLTPGAADPALTTDVLCAPGFSPKTIRNVPTARKKAIYRVYAMAPNQPPCPCEIDHLIPLAIGGSNAPRNLWPQPESMAPWNSTDWIAAYVARFGRPAP